MQRIDLNKAAHYSPSTFRTALRSAYAELGRLHNLIVKINKAWIPCKNGYLPDIDFFKIAWETENIAKSDSRDAELACKIYEEMEAEEIKKLKEKIDRLQAENDALKKVEWVTT